MRYFQYLLFNSNFNDLFYYKFNNSKRIIISTLNPHSFVVAERDNAFKKALLNADFLLVDGVGIKIILLIQFKIVKLFNGPYLHSQIISNFRKIKLKVFYMGSSEHVLNRIVDKLKIEAPLWDVETYSPPFTSVFSKDQNDIIINNVNKFKPDILFIGMTAPKQEKWVDINKNNLDANYIISIGAVFDFYSDVKKSAPKLIVNLNLIWAYRLLTDFKHVWRRTFISFPLFLYLNVVKSIKITR